jgi:hypothetical protein
MILNSGSPHILTESVQKNKSKVTSAAAWRQAIIHQGGTLDHISPSKKIVTGDYSEILLSAVDFED